MISTVIVHLHVHRKQIICVNKLNNHGSRHVSNTELFVFVIKIRSWHFVSVVLHSIVR